MINLNDPEIWGSDVTTSEAEIIARYVIEQLANISDPEIYLEKHWQEIAHAAINDAIKRGEIETK